MRRIIILVLVSTSFLNPVLAQNELGGVNFAVMALDVDSGSRRTLERALVARLLENDYQVSASYSVIRNLRNMDNQTIRTRLSTAGYDAVLIIRPLDIGRDATIETVQAYLTPERYRTIAEFVGDYRGDNFNSRAVIHVVGFILDETQSLPVWQGVMWFDDETHSVAEVSETMANMVEYNLNHYRPIIREQLGLPILQADQE
jgi:hypothetical protein